MKILAMQFRYLDDAPLMPPGLRTIQEHFLSCAVHVLVAEEFAPLLQHLPWLLQVWAFPWMRGKARLTQSWPFPADRVVHAAEQTASPDQRRQRTCL
jgi:ADP-heptose:LPS heptosyltransferase